MYYLDRITASKILFKEYNREIGKPDKVRVLIGSGGDMTITTWDIKTAMEFILNNRMSGNCGLVLSPYFTLGFNLVSYISSSNKRIAFELKNISFLDKIFESFEPLSEEDTKTITENLRLKPGVIKTII